MRVSDVGISTRLRENISMNNERLAGVEQELSSGKRINLPSDDPIAVSTALQTRTSLAVDTQYTRTAGTATSRLSAADTALSTLTDVLQRARELTVEAGSGTQSQAELNSTATELDQLLQQAIQAGNSNVAGQYLFGGTKTTTPPFAPVGANTSSVAYNGDDNPILVGIGPSTSIRLDVPGDQTFSSAFQALIQIRDGLRAGDTTNTVPNGLTSIDAALNGLLNTRASVGGRLNQLSQTTSQLAGDQTALQTLQSQLEDTDVADASVRLSSAQNVYSASLLVTARAMQTSLADFLK